MSTDVERAWEASGHVRYTDQVVRRLTEQELQAERDFTKRQLHGEPNPAGIWSQLGEGMRDALRKIHEAGEIDVARKKEAEAESDLNGPIVYFNPKYAEHPLAVFVDPLASKELVQVRTVKSVSMQAGVDSTVEVWVAVTDLGREVLAAGKTAPTTKEEHDGKTEQSA